MVVGIMAGVVGIFGGIARLGEHPLIAYFLVLGMLMGDVAVSSFFNANGVVGYILQETINLLTGVVIPITSFHILVIFAIFPLIMYALKN